VPQTANASCATRRQVVPAAGAIYNMRDICNDR
jgi:hypothetical protein